MTELIETEVKIKINNLEDFVDELLKSGAVFEGKDFQKTIRMDTPNLDLEKRKVFLRVRSGLGSIVTLKVKKDENKDFKLRDEYETEVKDINILTQIFTVLGFNKHFIMEKYRANYSYKGVEISVDELPFGIYVEFEGTKEGINNALKVFGFDNTERITITYWHIFDEIKKGNPSLGENIIFPKGYKSKLMEL